MENRTIDKLIAVHLFSWKKWTFHNPSRSGGIAFSHEGLVPPEYDGSDLQHLSMIMPHYSSDIAAAWMVVEKLIELGFYPAIWIKPGVVQVYDKDERCIVEEKAAVPMAICLAALKAVGVEVDHLS